MKIAAVTCLIAAGAFLGCASAPLAPDRVSALEASIQSADEVGADKVPQATLHIKLAREELEMAKTLAKNGDTERAELFLNRADVDAALAMALARSDAANADADAAAAAVIALQGAGK